MVGVSGVYGSATIGKVGAFGVDEVGRRKLGQPRGIFVDKDDKLLVADAKAQCIIQFAKGNLAGKVICGQEGKERPSDEMKVTSRGDILDPPKAHEVGHMLNQPCDVKLQPNGELFVLENGRCTVSKFTDASSRGEDVAPRPGTQNRVSTPEGLKYPRSFLVTAEGDIIVCDTWSHRILRFSADSGTPDVIAGCANSMGGQMENLAYPTSIALLSDGSLLVSDTNNNRIQKFAPGETRGTTAFGSMFCKPGEGLSELNAPAGICVNSKDEVFVADKGNKRVIRFRPGSKEGEVILDANKVKSPYGLCFDSKGFLYVSDERLAIVLKLDLDGKEDSAYGDVFKADEAKPDRHSDAAKADAAKPSSDLDGELD
jgi:sugar lactone lactonase YvrE